jgi:hypothetical protein
MHQKIFQTNQKDQKEKENKIILIIEHYILLYINI